MKILLIGNYQLDAIQSMDRFARMMETNASKLGYEARVIRPKVFWGGLALPPAPRKWAGYIDKFILFPAQLRQTLAWADVVHICDQGNAVYIKYLQSIPHLVTCHDLLSVRAGLGEFPEHRTSWTGKQLQQMMIKGLNQAQKIVCVSLQTQGDLLRLSSVNKDDVALVPMGLNYPYSPMAATEAKQRLKTLQVDENCQFFLHVGANHWYKNRLGVLEIFYRLKLKIQQPDFRLVMAGQPMTMEMRQFIQMHKLTDKVIELVNVDNESLRSLYSLATALIFPSLYEGFGWPIIEAQACGCPVFTSNRDPMQEVGGDAAIYIEPDRPESAAVKIIESLGRLEEFKLRGFVNSQRFTANKMIDEYTKLYQESTRKQ
jgi:glycosyltransferase involved in cell wall biosynthesis